MKTAILIIGHVRTWAECKNNFIESFQHLNPDVFVSTYNLQYNYHPAQQKWMGGQLDSYIPYNEIQKLFNGINLIGLDVEEFYEVMREYQSIRLTLNINFQDEVHTYLQFRKLNRGIELIKKAEEQKESNYDVIIKIRTDIHHGKFDYEVGEHVAIISDGNVFPNDVIIAATRDNFIRMNDFFKAEFYNPIYPDSHLKAPHNMLLRAFEYVGLSIERKPLMQYVIRKIGKQYYNNIS